MTGVYKDKVAKNHNIMNFDPNLTYCGRMARQKIKLVFGQWDYRKEVIATIHGNLLGYPAIECAIEQVFDQLEELDNGNIIIRLKRIVDGKKETLGCFYYDGGDFSEGSDWLKSMLIGAEILSMTPYKGHTI